MAPNQGSLGRTVAAHAQLVRLLSAGGLFSSKSPAPRGHSPGLYRAGVLVTLCRRFDGFARGFAWVPTLGCVGFRLARGRVARRAA